MVMKLGRSPFQLRSFVENLSPIDEEGCTDHLVMDLASHQVIGVDSIKPEDPNRNETNALCSSLLTDAPYMVEACDIATENIALEEHCLIYEAMLASMRDEDLAYKFKTSKGIEIMKKTVISLRSGNQSLMDECSSIEDRITALSLQLTGMVQGAS